MDEKPPSDSFFLLLRSTEGERLIGMCWGGGFGGGREMVQGEEWGVGARVGGWKKEQVGDTGSHKSSSAVTRVSV